MKLFDFPKTMYEVPAWVYELGDGLHKRLTVEVAEKIVVRSRLAEMQRHRCAYCQKSTTLTPTTKKGKDRETLDHVIPASKGGATDYDNCLMCCEGCNNKKANMSLEEFAQKRGLELPTSF